MLRILRRGPVRAAVVTLTVLTGVLAGCDRAPPRPIPHARLHIEENGSLKLDASPAQLDTLTATLQAREQALSESERQRTGLMVEIDASPKADIHVVKAALKAVEAAHARVSFGEDMPPGASEPGARYLSGFSF